MRPGQRSGESSPKHVFCCAGFPVPDSIFRSAKYHVVIKRNVTFIVGGMILDNCCIRVSFLLKINRFKYSRFIVQFSKPALLV